MNIISLTDFIMCLDKHFLLYQMKKLFQNVLIVILFFLAIKFCLCQRIFFTVYCTYQHINYTKFTMNLVTISNNVKAPISNENIFKSTLCSLHLLLLLTFTTSVLYHFSELRDQD